MTIKFIALTGSALALAFPGAAMAQNWASSQGAEETGIYVGGGYQFLDVETDDDIGDSTNALQARVGWQIIPNFALEAEASFGIDDGDFDFDGNEDDFDFDDNNDGDVADALTGNGDLGLDYLAGVYGKYTLPVTDSIDLYARAGYAFIEIDSTLTTFAGNSFDLSASESGFAFGAGAGYDLTESTGLRLDYTRYEFDDANADGVTASVEYKF